MLNEVKIQGRILRVTYRNDKILRLIIANESKFSHHKVAITCFKPELFDFICDNHDNVVTIKGQFSENNYKDSNGKWHNDYTISCEEIELS